MSSLCWVYSNIWKNLYLLNSTKRPYDFCWYKQEKKFTKHTSTWVLTKRLGLRSCAANKYISCGCCKNIFENSSEWYFEKSIEQDTSPEATESSEPMSYSVHKIGFENLCWSHENDHIGTCLVRISFGSVNTGMTFRWTFFTKGYRFFRF